MYKLTDNSSFFSWFLPTQPEAEIAALPLQEEDADSDIEELAKRRSSQATQLPNGCEIDKHCNVTKTSTELQLEHLLANILKYGVLIASAVVLWGGILYLIRHGAEPAEYKFFKGETSEFCSPVNVINAVLSGSRRGIIQFGLLLLIATPIVRVIVSVFAFIRLREFLYVFITLLVLSTLIYSLVGAYY